MLNIKLPYDPVILLICIYLKIYTFLHKDLYTNVQSNIIYNNQKVEMIQMSITGKWINKSRYSHKTDSYNGMLFGNRKEWSTDTYYNMNTLLGERSQIQKTTYCMTSFIENVQKKVNF